MKSFIKKILPEEILIGYHTMLAWIAAFWFGFPTKNMYVVGITGTKGKTSTANFIWSVLTSGGYKTGVIGTANIRIGELEQMNPYHMTMPGPFVLQKHLQKIKNAGCTHVVLEATSEGMKLGRHKGIYFDTAIFTNLSPEHLPSHGGSIENYRLAKAKLFKSLVKNTKKLGGKKIVKTSIINTDTSEGAYFYKFPADKKISYGLHTGDVRAENIQTTKTGTSFVVNSDMYTISILGTFNIENALPAIIVGNEQGISKEKIHAGIESLKLIPGRMEEINEGQKFRVIIDYAHEKLSMNALLDTAKSITKPAGNIIVLFGAQGGGRDTSKRESMGVSSGEKADFIILTSDDSYEEDPVKIINSIAVHVKKTGKVENKNLFLIVDRKEAIRKACSLAQEGDTVLIAGKGAEQTMLTKNGPIPWDDRIITRDILKSME